jgi:DNA uptake protein ComE-like DNA-binding protein
MQRNLPATRNSFAKMKLSILIFVLMFGGWIASLKAAQEWTRLQDCRLIANPANDGDSFHVSAGEKEYVLRLYLVDAPEIDAGNPARLVEQARYFQLTVPQTIDLAEAAKEFVQEKLSRPFTVLTRMAEAGGRSRIGRVYALVETTEGDLGELLVRNGLARIYGARVTPPGFADSHAELEKLNELEKQAAQEKIGAWGITSGRLRSRAEKSTLALSTFALAKKDKAREADPVLASSRAALAKIDINKATPEELESIPGIGSVLAGRIVAARPFKTVDELREVKGLGAKKYAAIRPFFAEVAGDILPNDSSGR